MRHLLSDKDEVMDEVRLFLEWCATNGITPMTYDGFGNSHIPAEWAATMQERRVSGSEWSVGRLLQYYSDENV